MRLDRRSALLGLGALSTGAASLAGAIASPSYDEPDEMYSALRNQKGQRFDIAGGGINVVFADGAPGLDRTRVYRWIHTGAAALSAYFGRFPVKDYGLLVIAQPGDRIGSATTFGYEGSATRINVGIEADEEDFERDWVLVHEMIHTALPDVPRRALWLQEGNATYVEPIARALIGNLPVTEVWSEASAGMPKGEPRAEEGGMDGTHRWGRLYWGGATFWLLAEIAIFTQTRGSSSLRDALRHINRTSGGNSVDWTPERVMETGDQVTQTHTLRDLYARFASKRVETDLNGLFGQLGITVENGRTLFNDRAPLAELRERITSR